MALPQTAFPVSTGTLLNVRTLPKIRLDRAQRFSIAQAAGAALYSQVSLFNNSMQNHLLVVRGLTWGPSTSGPLNLGMVSYQFGNASTLKNQPVLPDRALLPGQVFSQNGGSPVSADTVLFLQSLEQSYSGEYPAVVVPPTWSCALSPQAVNLGLTVSFLWECLTPDEFVDMYGEFA